MAMTLPALWKVMILSPAYQSTYGLEETFTFIILFVRRQVNDRADGACYRE